MNALLKLMTGLFMLIIFTGCTGRSTGFEGYFWTASPELKNCNLRIDNIDLGALPYIPSEPDCDDMNLTNRAISFKLSAGDHDIELINKNGEVEFTEILFVKRSSGSTTIRSTTQNKDRGVKGSSKGNCLARVFTEL